MRRKTITLTMSEDDFDLINESLAEIALSKNEADAEPYRGLARSLCRQVNYQVLSGDTLHSD